MLNSKQTAYGDIAKTKKKKYVEASAESCSRKSAKFLELQEKVDDSRLRAWALPV